MRHKNRTDNEKPERFFIRPELILDIAMEQSDPSHISPSHALDRSGKRPAFEIRQQSPDTIDKRTGSKYLIVIGSEETLPTIQDLRHIATRSGLNICVIASWDRWRISLYPHRFDFDLHHVDSSIILHRNDVHSAWFFGDPAGLRDVGFYQQYASLERSALLMAMMAMCGSDAFERLEAIYSGWSDEPVREQDLLRHLGLSRWPRRWEELFLWEHGVECLDNARSATSLNVKVPQAAGQLWIVRGTNNTVLPRKGILPAWILQSPKWTSCLGAKCNAAPSLISIFPNGIQQSYAPSRDMLVLAHKSDSVAEAVCRTLETLHCKSTLLDISSIDRRTLPAVLRRIHLSGSVFVRALQPSSDLCARRTYFDLLRRLEEVDVDVLNRPSSGASNYSKVLHLLQLQTLGWSIPATIATNDEKAAREFVHTFRKVVYKSCSAIRSIPQLFRVRDHARLLNLRYCPVLFQQRVPGTDCRAHVVHQRVVCAFVRGSAVDDRGGSRRVQECQIARDITERCIVTRSRLKLGLGGIDLKIGTLKNRAVALECNCMPAFTHFGDRITAAVTRAMMGLD